MKRIIILFIPFLIFVSCQLTERVYIKEDGSVVYESGLDFSALTDMVYSPEQIDSLRNIGEYPMDTVINFADISNVRQMEMGEISEKEMEFLNSLDQMKLSFRIDDNIGDLNFRVEENSVESFNAYQNRMQQTSEELKKENASQSLSAFQEMGLLNPLELSYNGKTFTRNSGPLGLPEQSAEDSLDLASLYIFNLEYHFPKKIKSISVEEAQIGPDGKSLIISVPMADYLAEPEKYNFKVDFE